MLIAPKAYITYNKEQLDKIGNTAIYLAERVGHLTKTKLLKLFYILDEYSILRGGVPFLDLTYKVWKYGPVSEEMYVDLTNPPQPIWLKPYIRIEEENIKPVSSFNDDEFTDNDIDLMNIVIESFGKKKAHELNKYTHRKNSPWHTIAMANNILDDLLNETISNTEYKIDLELLINHYLQKNATL